MLEKICRLCGAGNVKILFEARATYGQERFSLLRCGNCEAVFTFPLPDAKERNARYPKTYRAYHENEGRGLSRAMLLVKRAAIRGRYAARASLLEKLIAFIAGRRFGITREVKDKRILDVGCGDGFFLSAIADSWDAEGLELDADAAKRARAVGLKVSTGEFTSSGLPAGRYDVVRAYHVLEHFDDPQLALKEFGRILKADGLLIIAVPRFDSFAASLFREGWSGLHLPFHVFHFTKKRIERLCRENGFEVIGIDNYSVGSFAGSLRRAIWRRMHAGSMPDEILEGRDLPSLLLTIALAPAEAIVDFLGKGDAMAVYCRKLNGVFKPPLGDLSDGTVL